MPGDTNYVTGLERAWQSLTGLRLGDAFGGSFFWKTDLAERVQNRQLSPDEWRWSDDTAMGRSVYMCLVLHKKIVPDALADLFSQEYLRDPVRGYGTMAHTYLHEIGQGVPWQEAAGVVFDGKGSYGNGAAMRAGPVGAYFAGDIERVLDQARQSAIVTHAHPEGQAGAMAVAAAAAWAVQAKALNGREMLHWVWSHTPAGLTRSNLERALAFPLDQKPEEAAALLGSGQRITAQDTVPFALWCAARHLDSYPEALWATVAGEGDMDTTGAIVGSIVALCAHEGIPEQWQSQAEAMSLPQEVIGETVKYQIAEGLLAEGRVVDAIQIYRGILERDRDDWRGHLALGECYFKENRITDGLGHFQEVARLAPREAGPAYLARAELLLQQGEPENRAALWFRHAADCFLKKSEMERYEAVRQRMLELGWELEVP